VWRRREAGGEGIGGGKAEGRLRVGGVGDSGGEVNRKIEKSTGQGEKWRGR